MIRLLLSGKLVDRSGQFFTVENARLYTLPDSPPPILVAGAAENAAELAGRIGDGFIGVQPKPELIEAFDGALPPDRTIDRPRPKYLQVNVCVAETEAEAQAAA